ncbi:MAG: DEAD/DEAH box helicase [Firmicutes bacterium]|jgi:ATP-dependent RNA helicase DeaD|nr:DEAD/DEAH box helicase [Bacillota bacterium]
MNEKKFTKLGISEALEKGLNDMNIVVPTAIQQEVIPAILKGTDVIARSETGSGKTFAYLLPLFEKIDVALKKTQVIILTPTHELAAQVQKQIELLSKFSNMEIKSALIIGSASMTRQIEKLKQKPHIVVGSAGRILDLIQKRKISAHTVQTIVLDEGDRLLDELNINAVKAVIKTTLKQRQLVVLSATITAKTIEESKNIMKCDAVEIAIQNSIMPNSISHNYILSEKRQKFIILRKIIAGEKPTKAIVFLNNKENIAVIVDKLCYHGLKADGIYGTAYKTERQNALENFRQGNINILVSSDIGARGLDIEGVTHIINMDMPEDPTYYLHRAGRTGRQDIQGKVISIVTPYEKRWLQKYQKTWHITFEQKEMSFGKLSDSSAVKKQYQSKKQYPKKKIKTTKYNHNKQNKKNSKKNHYNNNEK